jgi:toxin ParE1/3/4
LKVVVREEAYADLERIHSWISKDSPANAASGVERLLVAIESKIPAFPYLGRTGSVSSTREWVVSGLPYIIVYSVDAHRELVTVLAVFHGARNR